MLSRRMGRYVCDLVGKRVVRDKEGKITCDLFDL